MGQEDTLALINGRPITSEDFRNRYELSVYPGKGYRDTSKVEFLYSMIAEKLLSQAAVGGGQPLTPEESEIRKQAEEIFLRDALFRTEVLPKIKITNSELVEGLKRSTYFYIVDAFYFMDSSSAVKFYKDYESSRRNIYDLASSMGISHDTLQIGYGESTEEIENAFFGHPNGFISKPVLTVDGWVIFRVIDRRVNPKFSSAAINDRLEMVRKIIQGRKETLMGMNYLFALMKGIRVEVNYSIFRPLVYSIQKLISTHHPPSFDPYYYLSPQEIMELRRDFSSRLSEPLLSFNGGSISLERVFDELPLAGFNSIDTTLPQITVGLHSALKFISQNYFLARKARELGLQNSEEVRYNVQMLLDAYRSMRMAKEITDTVHVTQAQVDSFFETHHDQVLRDVELKLKIFKESNINQAVDVFNELLRNKKEASKDTSGEWVQASHLGELGAVLAEQEDGSIYGPIAKDGKLIIFKVIDKRSKISNKSIEQSIDVAKQMAVAQEKQRVLDEYIAKLAEQSDLKIYYSKIHSLDVTPIQMLTFRYIGFGGKILAVPPLFPRESWIRYYKNTTITPP
ncbi:MAG: hypothetical protein ACP5MI_00400 [Candidatus Kryptoniota bacterium]